MHGKQRRQEKKKKINKTEWPLQKKDRTPKKWKRKEKNEKQNGGK